MSDTRDMAERIAESIANEAIDYDNEDADGNRHPYVMEGRAAAIIRAELAASPELREVREAMVVALDEMSDDHACYTTTGEEKLRSALAALDRIAPRTP